MNGTKGGHRFAREISHRNLEGPLPEDPTKKTSSSTRSERHIVPIQAAVLMLLEPQAGHDTMRTAMVMRSLQPAHVNLGMQLLQTFGTRPHRW